MKNVSLKILGIFLITCAIAMIGCNKSTCEKQGLTFHGHYEYDQGSGLYLVSFNDNYKEAEDIVKSSVEGKFFIVCCNPSFDATTGQICFDFRLAEDSEKPITGGPGPVPNNTVIKLLKFKE